MLFTPEFCSAACRIVLLPKQVDHRPIIHKTGQGRRGARSYDRPIIVVILAQPPGIDRFVVAVRAAGHVVFGLAPQAEHNVKGIYKLYERHAFVQTGYRYMAFNISPRTF